MNEMAGVDRRDPGMQDRRQVVTQARQGVCQ